VPERAAGLRSNPKLRPSRLPTVEVLSISKEAEPMFMSVMVFMFLSETVVEAEGGFAFQHGPGVRTLQPISKPGCVGLVAMFFEKVAFDMLKKGSSE
jgi:hypothetical protein